MDKKALIRDYLSVREKSHLLCTPLATEDYVAQPSEETSPPRWHLAHTTWFFENFLLKPFKKGYQSYHPLYDYLFNSYYQHLGERWEKDRRGELTRPTVKEIYVFRKATDLNMKELIETVPDDQFDEVKNLTLLGINHEQQHQELLLYDIKYLFSNNPMNPRYKEEDGSVAGEKLPPLEWVSFDEGIYSIGYQGNGFYYDNEKPVHKTYLHPFRIASLPVTNGEFLQFVEKGGYDDFRFWLDAGWHFIKTNNIKHPLYWQKEGGQWLEWTMNGLQTLDKDAPVSHVSFYEAEAFAEWMGKRLPAEQEWEVAAQKACSSIHGNFMEKGIFHPCGKIIDNAEKSEPILKMFGDTWEWTYSAYLPYPGYKQQPGPLGEYNGKFMINQMVLRGGSWASPASHIRTSYRNFFYPEMRWMVSGFRLADND